MQYDREIHHGWSYLQSTGMLELWAKGNKCDQNEKTVLYNGDVEKSTSLHGDHKEVLVHYYIRGFGRGWPTTGPLNIGDHRHGPTVLLRCSWVVFSKSPMR